MEEFAVGLRGFARSLGFAFGNGLWWLFLVPLVFWIAFAAGMFWLSNAIVVHAQDWLHAHLAFPTPAPQATGWLGFWNDLEDALSTSGTIIAGLVLRLAFFFLFSLVSKYIVLIALSPVLAYASELTEEKLTGVRHRFRLGRFLLDVGRGVLMAFRNGLLELGINILGWTLTVFFPPAAVITAPVLWLTSCWFYGFSMFDYVFERRRLGIGPSAREARAHGRMVLANGICFNLLMKIPLVGIMFAPLMASIGAGLAWYAPREDRNVQGIRAR